MLEYLSFTFWRSSNIGKMSLQVEPKTIFPTLWAPALTELWFSINSGNQGVNNRMSIFFQIFLNNLLLFFCFFVFLLLLLLLFLFCFVFRAEYVFKTHRSIAVKNKWFVVRNQSNCKNCKSLLEIYIQSLKLILQIDSTVKRFHIEIPLTMRAEK